MKEHLLVGAGLWLANFSFSHDVTVAYIGVPWNVLIACFIGTFCSFSIGKKVEPRSAMWGIALTCIFMGCAFTAIANAVLTLTTPLEMTPGLQAGVGTVVSFITRFFLPWLAEVVSTGKWIAWIPFIGGNKK